MKRAVVCGAGGFIGCHLVSRLKREGDWEALVSLREGIEKTYPWAWTAEHVRLVYGTG